MGNKKNEDTIAIPTVTQETLDATPERALKLLRGIGTVPAIRAALAARGYSADEHALGWKLLHDVSGYSPGGAELGVVVDPEVTRAIATLDAWDEDGFRIVRAAVTRFPDQAKTLLEGIGPSTGAASVLGVRTLLDRIDALEKTKDGHAAMKVIAARGISPEERKRLRGLVAIAEKGTSITPGKPSEEETQAAAAHQKSLLALRAWYEEWSEMCRAVIKRKDRLIRLGLARRKSPNKSAPTPPATGAVGAS